MKAQFILATVLSLTTVSVMAAPQHHTPQHRSDKVTVIHHYHQVPHHKMIQARRIVPQRHISSHHQHPVASRYVQHRPMIVTPSPVRRVHDAPLRPIPLRPVTNFSVSVNL